MHRTALTVVVAASSAALAQDCQWQHVPAVPEGDFSSVFEDVAGSSPTNIWAVGSTTNFAFPSLDTRALIERYDGEQWSIVPHPLDPDNNALDAIVVVSENEVYAFGDHRIPSLGTSAQPLFMIWDGSEWEVGPGITITIGGGIFHDAIMIDGELWAFGRRTRTDPPPAPGGYPLAARWDGSRWIETPPPLKALHGQDSFNTIFGVDATSADDIWAVGTAHQQARFTGDPDAFYTHYITHYDGSTWRIINDAPNPTPQFTSISDVAVSGSDVWVVGYHSPGTGNEAYLAHFDGTTWTLEDLSWLPGSGAILRGVTARAPDDVYAAGLISDGGGFPSPLILHFDGASWTQMPVGPTDGENEQYFAISTIEGGDLWAVGNYFTPHDAPLSHRLACDTCRADLDGDGELTLFDFLAFQNLFDAGSSEADFDGDGSLTLFDFLAFQNDFDAGCS